MLTQPQQHLRCQWCLISSWPDHTCLGYLSWWSVRFRNAQYDYLRFLGSGWLFSTHVFRQGELHGITALSIMTDVIYNFHNFKGTMTAVCDNQGVITKCVTPSNTSLRRQHDTNHDLYLTQHHYRKKTNLKLEWVKGHTDKSPWQLTEDLLFQKTGKEAIFNIWCDRVTQQTWHTGVTGMPDPEATHIERWSVFSKTHIFTRLLDTSTRKFMLPFPLKKHQPTYSIAMDSQTPSLLILMYKLYDITLNQCQSTLVHPP